MVPEVWVGVGRWEVLASSTTFLAPAHCTVIMKSIVLILIVTTTIIAVGIAMNRQCVMAATQLTDVTQPGVMMCCKAIQPIKTKK